eukprot:15259922-Ditylum_brightwellii.AAC.1
MESIIVKSQDGNGKGGLTLNTLRSLHICTQNSEEGAPPPDMDHQKHTNPYPSKYRERLKEKIKESKDDRLNSGTLYAGQPTGNRAGKWKEEGMPHCKRGVLNSHATEALNSEPDDHDVISNLE